MAKKPSAILLATPAETQAVDPQDPIIAFLIEKLGLPREEVIDELEKAAERNPVFANRIRALQGFITKLYDGIADPVIRSAVEGANLFQTGSGPVKSNIGDTA